MGRAGISNSECPACHKKKVRRKDEVCVDCLELIEIGKHFDQVYKSLSEMAGVLIESRVPASWCLPYYAPYKTGSGSEIYKKIAEKITELARAVSLPSPVAVNKWSYIRYLMNSLQLENRSVGKASIFKKWSNRDEKFDYEQDRIFEKTTHDLLSELDRLIRDGIKETEKKAVEYGKDLLMQLNNNEVTPEDFLKG